MKKKMKRKRMNWKACQVRTSEIRAKLGREITPRDVIKDAWKNPSSPYYSHFTWSKSKGWYKNLLAEARDLLANLKVLYHDDDGNVVPVREYVRLMVRQPSTHKLSGGYVPIPKIQSSDYLLRQSVVMAMKELETWKRRWTAFQQIASAFIHVDKAIRVLAHVSNKGKIVAS